MKSIDRKALGWLATTPENWPIRPAKAMFSERREPSTSEDVHLTPSQAYGVVPQEEYMIITGNRVVLNLTGQDGMKHVEPDDFIIHLRSFQGGLEHSTLSGKVSVAYTVISPRQPAHPGYFRWLLKSDAYIQQLRTTTNQLRDGQSIKFRDFAKVPLPCPPHAEQRRIAVFLDRETAKIDLMVAEQEGLIEVLRERRVAVITRTVTTGLDATATLVPTGVDWLGETPRHWDVKRLKYSVGSTQTGIWGSDPAGDEDDVLCVRVADFDRPRLRVSDDVPTVRNVKASDRLPRLLAPGDLLLEKSGGTGLNPVGFVGIFEGAEEPAVSSNFLTRLRVAQGQHPRYWLYAHAASYSTRLTARSVNQTTGIQNLDQAAYFDELFPFPPFEEQQAIADYLDEQVEKIDALIAEAEGIVTVAKERRSALITAAVTGQFDVRGEVA